jgi:hypothetical protein
MAGDVRVVFIEFEPRVKFGSKPKDPGRGRFGDRREAPTATETKSPKLTPAPLGIGCAVSALTETLVIEIECRRDGSRMLRDQVDACSSGRRPPVGRAIAKTDAYARSL